MKANGITQTTSRTTTTNAQVERYAVVTQTMDLIKEKVEVNIIINLYGFKHSCFLLFSSQISLNNSSSVNVKKKRDENNLKSQCDIVQ